MRRLAPFPFSSLLALHNNEAVAAALAAPFPDVECHIFGYSTDYLTDPSTAKGAAVLGKVIRE